jgi:hypothetical protein
VTQQLAAERRALLARKRAQQDERRRKADDLERILHENQRKVAPQGCIWVAARLCRCRLLPALAAAHPVLFAVCPTVPSCCFELPGMTSVKLNVMRRLDPGGGSAEEGCDGARAPRHQPGCGRSTAAQVAESGHPHCRRPLKAAVGGAKIPNPLWIPKQNSTVSVSSDSPYMTIVL